MSSAVEQMFANVYQRDPQKSAQPCGCDEGADHVCERHRKERAQVHESEAIQRVAEHTYVVKDSRMTDRPAPLFPDSAQGRKDHPVFTGVLMYFPDAIAAIARVSKKGNDQHNPGQPLHWAREKSTDQMDTAIRHSMDHGTGHVRDNDGEYHLAKAGWRIMAELQLTIEQERGFTRS